jgi:hypothetical protein
MFDGGQFRTAVTEMKVEAIIRIKFSFHSILIGNARDVAVGVLRETTL